MFLYIPLIHTEIFVLLHFRTLFPPDRPDYTRRLVHEADIDPDTTSVNLDMEEFKRLCITYKNICDEETGMFEYNFRSRESAALRRKSGAVLNLGL